jgi:glutathione S-transferase
MTEPVTFYTNPRSRGAIVRWMLEETGLAYRTVVLPFGPAMKTAEYRAVNPMGKVPAIVAGGRVVTEAAAICLHLADIAPEAGLAPPPGARAAYYRWILFGAGPLEAAVSNRALGWDVPVEKRGMIGYGHFEAVVDTLEAAVEAAPFLAGEQFTAADVYTGSQIGWGLMFGTLPDRPALRDYWSRIEGRPARLRAAALDAAAAEGGGHGG